MQFGTLWWDLRPLTRAIVNQPSDRRIEYFLSFDDLSLHEVKLTIPSKLMSLVVKEPNGFVLERSPHRKA